MTDQQGASAAEITVDTDNLHREEVFTDLHAASIRRLTPVKADGSADSGRDVIYIGETNLMTQMGPLPVQFPIEAKSLGDAFGQFAEGVREAVERLNERAKEMVREESSRIVVPGAAPPGPGGMGAAGMRPGAGKFLFDK
ncbi:MAG: hypothetical protein V3R72_06220 [Gammaproteobacteria bacterium]